MIKIIAGVLLVAALVLSAPVDNDVTQRVDVRMPNVQPQKKDTYLCHGKKVTSDVFLTGFEPHAHMQTAHHMLVFGCEAPGLERNVWNCGEMQSKDSEGHPQYPLSSPCSGGMKILYAWGSDAPELKLPEGIGFKVGPNTNVNYIVLQVHYKNVDKFTPPNNGTDKSGVSLVYTKKEQPKLAGVYMMGTAGELPAHSIEYFESACAMLENQLIHPFAFRVHAHTHGVVNSAYRVRGREWTLIGKQSPQKPQMFYPVAQPGMTIGQGDIIAMRCTMENKENRTIPIGSTQNDEMCNYYMMYYVDNGKLLHEDTCWTDGPPDWYFDSVDGLDENDVPKEASMAPGSDKVLEKTTHKATDDVNEVSDDIQSMMISELERMIAEQRPETRVFNDNDQLTLEDIRNLRNFYKQYYNNEELPEGGYLEEPEVRGGYDIINDEAY